MRAPQWRAIFAAILLLAGAPAPLAAQRVRGTLYERTIYKPVAAATVTLLAEGDISACPSVVTDSAGGFALRAPRPGVYRLHVAASGYRGAVTPAVALLPGDEITLAVRLSPDTLVVSPVEVVAYNRWLAGDLAGFNRRMHLGVFGRFITRQQIEKARPFRVTDLLFGVPGLQVLPSMRGFRSHVRTTEGCRPMVFLDGLRFPLLGESVDDLVPAWELAGIEVYPRAIEVPVEFQGLGARCGAVLLWRRGDAF